MTGEIYERLTYGVEVGPARMLPEKESRLEAPAPGIAAAVLRRSDGLVVVSMESEADDEASRAAATDFVQGLMDYLSLRVGHYEAPIVSLEWGADPGRPGRRQFLRATLSGAATLTATVAPDPEEVERFAQAGPARILNAQGSWVGLLLTRLRESSEIGGCGGFIVLYDAVKAAAGVVAGCRPGERTADAWIRGVLPSTATSPKPGRPDILETEFTRIRNELAHCEERGVSPGEAVAQADRRLAGLQGVVRKALRRELWV